MHRPVLLSGMKQKKNALDTDASAYAPASGRSRLNLPPPSFIALKQVRTFMVHELPTFEIHRIGGIG